MELIVVPRAGVCEGDMFGFYGGNLIKIGGECGVVGVDQVNGGEGGDGVSQDGGERRGVDGFEVPEYYGAFLFDEGAGMSISRVIARWSEMVRSVLVRLLMVMPEVQTRSSVCPFLWVGKSMCCVILKFCKMSWSPVVTLQSLESTWML